MKHFSLIYPDSCPNYKPIKQMPEEIGLTLIGIN